MQGESPVALTIKELLSSAVLGGVFALVVSSWFIVQFVQRGKIGASIIILPAAVGGALAIFGRHRRVLRLVAAVLMVVSGYALLFGGLGVLFFVAAIAVALGLGAPRAVSDEPDAPASEPPSAKGEAN